MLLNKILFPAPKPPHYTSDSHGRNLFWLPPDTSTNSSIPCMFYSPKNLDNKPIEYFIIFCHGNGCDIGTMHYTLNEFSKHLNVYIISFEYPSYGLCTAQSPNHQTINNHADRTLKFVRDTLQWPIERIIIYGHSIGSGAGCYLASTNNIAALILQSPYTAIYNLVREKVGLILSALIRSRSWDNLEAMKSITCPVLFIHGRDDQLIPSNHSQILYDACLNTEGKKLIILPMEDHNSMSETTLLKYIKPFMAKQYKLIDTDIVLPIIKIDEELYEQPNDVSNNNSNGGIVNSILAMSRASTAATRSAIHKISGTKTDESHDNE